MEDELAAGEATRGGNRGPKFCSAGLLSYDAAALPSDGAASEAVNRFERGLRVLDAQ